MVAVKNFCEIALEEALRIQKSGAASEVIVVTVGLAQSMETVRTTLVGLPVYWLSVAKGVSVKLIAAELNIQLHSQRMIERCINHYLIALDSNGILLSTTQQLLAYGNEEDKWSIKKDGSVLRQEIDVIT
ncbi:hypothetical protein Taro_009863 [Colocasia esculenta]|uniref:Uncharacterized protein n=1 Tax=Colocasia esculenta TaxID=4460 RepID=A0A843U1S6_COLES|nr:hypothetical protein [Colocasia esculenta]